MKLKVIDFNGVEKKEIDVNDDVFNIQPNRYAIYEAIKNELANKRQGTSSTKKKSEVSGSGAKPWKQKGTGRARSGHKRSPLWIHGGVAFGPKPRDYSYVLPKKVKNLAFRSLFSQKNSLNNLLVLESFPVKEGKTKELLTVLKNLKKYSEKISLIVTDKDELVKRSGRNLPLVNCLSFSRLNVHDLYYSESILITEESIMGLNTLLSK
jgi:large subunit ribosomal protein L4